jgi:hypothetical protein
MLNNHKIIEKYNKRLRQTEEQYHARIAEAGLILVTGVLIVIWICVVLF